MTDGKWTEPTAGPESVPPSVSETVPAGEAVTHAIPERTLLLSRPVTELPDKVEEEKKVAERKPIKGIPAVEFRHRCDLIFEKFDRDKKDILKYEEVVALMDAGGRLIEEYDAYASLCGRLGC